MWASVCSDLLRTDTKIEMWPGQTHLRQITLEQRRSHPQNGDFNVVVYGSVHSFAVSTHHFGCRPRQLTTGLHSHRIVADSSIAFAVLFACLPFSSSSNLSPILSASLRSRSHSEVSDNWRGLSHPGLVPDHLQSPPETLTGRAPTGFMRCRREHSPTQ